MAKTSWWKIGADEGEVTQYLGCEVIRDRTARTAKLVQAGYAERVLRTFGMWDCKSIHTPLDANSRLTKDNCPEVVDPILHRRYRSIAGCLNTWKRLNACYNMCAQLMIRE